MKRSNKILLTILVGASPAIIVLTQVVIGEIAESSKPNYQVGQTLQGTFLGGMVPMACGVFGYCTWQIIDEYERKKSRKKP